MPPMPQAATASTSDQLNGGPLMAAGSPGVAGRTGNTRAIHKIHGGVVLPNAMKIPDRNSTGRATALTTGAVASVLGMAPDNARPSAQNAAEPTSTTPMNRSSDVPVGIEAW